MAIAAAALGGAAVMLEVVRLDQNSTPVALVRFRGYTTTGRRRDARTRSFGRCEEWRVCYYRQRMLLNRGLIFIGISVIVCATLFFSIHALAGGQSTAAASALAAIKAGNVRLALRLLNDVGDVNVDDAALLYEAVMHRQPEIIEK